MHCGGVVVHWTFRYPLPHRSQYAGSATGSITAALTEEMEWWGLSQGASTHFIQPCSAHVPLFKAGTPALPHNFKPEPAGSSLILDAG